MLLALHLALLVACSGADERPPPAPNQFVPAPGSYAGCEHVDFEACHYMQPECQQRVFTMVSCIRGDESATAPQTVSMSEEELATFLRDAMAAEPGIAPALLEAYEVLGLTVPAEGDDEAAIDAMVASIAAFYDFDTRKVHVVHAGGDFDYLTGTAVLAHEFTHALQDRDTELSRLVLEHSGTIDESLATRSLVEGEASLYENVVAAISSGLNGSDATDARTFDSLREAGEEIAVTEPTPLDLPMLLMPYTYGAEYAFDHWRRGGSDALRALYESPPRYTLEVIDHDAGAALGTSDALDGLTPSPPPAVALVDTDSLGAWVLFAFAAREMLTVEQARALARGWRGDRLEVYSDAASTTALWRIRLDDAASAAQLAQAADLTPSPQAVGWRALHDERDVVVIASSSTVSLAAWLEVLGVAP